jgi:hypothetical protein
VLTLWNGPGVPADNIVSTDIFEQRLLQVITQDFPGLVTMVGLAAQAHAVNIWVGGDAPIWYAIDEDPGPLTAPTSDPFVLLTAFRPGGVVQPQGWQQCVLPLDGLEHHLHLLSPSPSVTVTLVMLVEAL